MTEILNKYHKTSDKSHVRNLAIHWLKIVHMPNPEEVFMKYPHQVSGGMAQKAMIALALCSRPKLLIADEPTTALDAPVRKEIMLLLKKLQKKFNLTIIFITHNMKLVKVFADAGAVLLSWRKF